MTKVKETKLDQIKFDSQNANKGTERGRGVIEASLREFGFADAGTLDKNNTIIGGNKRTEVAGEIGMDEAIIIDVDGTKPVFIRRNDLSLDDPDDDRARRLAYQLNRSQEVSLAWDAEQLLADINAGVDFNGIFNQDELDALLAGLVQEEPIADPGPQIDKANELRQQYGVELGQIWTLDKHRLICGDSTDKATVDRLMQGEKAVCMWTDPPYGVSYVGKTKDALTIENDGSAGLPQLLKGAFECADMVLVDGAPIYVAHPAGALQMVFNTAFVNVGWKFHETLIWLKDSMVLGHSDYHYKHEPIMYGWKGKNRFWYAGRDRVSVLEFARPKRSEEHPTMKPIELVVACLENSTSRGNIIYEPFSGSGTTLIAAEQLGRQCRACELDEGYIAVALDRFERATNRQPARVE